MRERSIRCTGEEVRNIVAERQKQLRRPLSPQPRQLGGGWWEWGYALGAPKKTSPRKATWHGETWRLKAGSAPLEAYCPFGQPGDRLWVRETWGDGSAFYPHSPVLYGADEPADLGASCRNQAEADRAQGREHRVLEGCRCHFRWRPSIHMPRTASRLSLEVLSVRVEREDAGAWEWVMEFKRLEAQHG